VRKPILDNLQLHAIITDRLNHLWSPEQIAGRLKRECGSSPVSYVTIYRAIYSGSINVPKKCLRRARRGYTPHSTEKRGRIHDYRKISERPQEADKRTHNGHWEGDTMRGGRAKGALATFVDRKSSFLVAQVMPDRKADTLCLAMSRAFRNFPCALRQTFTVDHGNEFFSYRKIEDDLNTKVYFADPYSSWQRGLNENTNGLLRQYFPKKFDFLTLTQQELDMVVDALNNRPRKKLGFLSPCECFPTS
jgi:IS30 family transposase